MRIVDVGLGLVGGRMVGNEIILRRAAHVIKTARGLGKGRTAPLSVCLNPLHESKKIKNLYMKKEARAQWDKISLENLIFYSAELAGCALYSVNGSLHAVPTTPLLQALLALYERFFAGENRLFLLQATEQEKAENAAFAHSFGGERKENPLRISFHLPVIKCRENKD